MRPVLFVLLIIGLQGALAVLLPFTFPPPDLFLLAALAVGARLSPPLALGVAYGIGLLQDVLGAGLIGFHGAGIAAGAAAAIVLRRLFSAETSFTAALAVLVAEWAKWLSFIALNYWTRQQLITASSLSLVMAPEIIATMLLAPFVFAFAAWAFGPVPSSEERLL
jgi:rod shape-determining protein MreD